MPAFDAFVLCGTPRSGSTLLCDLLASTKAAGNPDSFYRRQTIAWWAGQWKLPAPHVPDTLAFKAAFLEAAIAAGKGGTDIFGLRLMRENLEELLAILNELFPCLSSDRARFEKAFGKTLYVHLSREDKLSQAISRVKAEQTGLWHIAPDGTEIERLAPPQEPHYDFERLRQEVASLERYDGAWLTWFRDQGIEPLRISYDDLSADPAAALIRICAALGVQAPNPGDIRPGVAKLADTTSVEWKRRYMADDGAAVSGK
ncbi:Stf0 family sulphotransferase [soil metagenome]